VIVIIKSNNSFFWYINFEGSNLDMGDRRKVLENSFLYTFSTLLAKAIGFLLIPIYTTFLSPADYGIINLLNGFTNIATLLVSFSIYSAVIRFYSDLKNNGDKLKKFFGTLIIFVFFSGTFFVLLGIVFSEFFISLFLEGISFFPFYLIALFSITFVSIHTLHQSILRSMQVGKKLTTINLAVFAINILVTLFFIGLLKLGALGVLLSAFTINFVYFFYMVFDLKYNNLVKFEVDFIILKEVLHYSIPLMPHDLSTQIANFASRVFINTNENLSSVGLYGISSQFGAIIDTIQSSVNMAFAPWFFEKMNTNNIGSRKDIVYLSHFLIILYSVVYMIIGLFSQEMIFIMTNEKYFAAWTIIPIFVLAYSVKSIYYFYVNILFFYKDAVKKIFVATVTGSLVDVILAYIFIPKFGLYGAAVSFLIAKIIVVAIVVSVSRKYNDIGFSVIKMLSVIVPSLLFMGVGLWFSYTKFINELNLLNFIFKLIIFGLYISFIYLSNKKSVDFAFKSKIYKNIFKKN